MIDKQQLDLMITVYKNYTHAATLFIKTRAQVPTDIDTTRSIEEKRKEGCVELDMLPGWLWSPAGPHLGETLATRIDLLKGVSI
jgi:hypothetical protein